MVFKGWYSSIRFVIVIPILRWYFQVHCWILYKAGLVKWYNSGFPNRGQEFDSPIPHN